MNEKQNILIAGCAESSITLITEFFQEKFEIIIVQDSAETIACLQGLIDKLALLMLSSKVKKENDYAVLRYIDAHALHDQLPVIIMSDEPNEQDELKAYSYGVDDIINLPVPPNILKHRVENMITLYATKNQLWQELNKRTEELNDVVRYDQTTGLLNMRPFYAEAEKIIRNTDANTVKDYVIFYSNIRNFRYYNVRYGNEEGDVILQKLSYLIRKFMPRQLTGRIAQDHFASLLKTSHPEILADLVCKEFNQVYGANGMSLHLGYYRLTGKTESIATSCELAKLACDSIYNAAENYYEYTKDLSQKFDRNAYIVQHFEEALEKKYIKVYFQPVVRTLTGLISGMEALVRWDDPNTDFMSPAEFIPVLEENRLITKLDLYVLEEICRGMDEFTREGKRILPTSLNLSRVDFLEGDIVTEVNNLLEKYNITHDMIHIEITESTLMYNPGKINDSITRFRALGYQVWMDDFGSGYSSLNVLKDYQFDLIKLDMKFLQAFDEKSKEIVKSIIAMAKNIGIRTLAEGVETDRHLKFLRAIGCEHAQGYLFSKPIPPEEITAKQLASDERTESKLWRKYYNAQGAPNFLTEKSFAIFEYDGQNFHCLYANRHYRETLYKTGLPDYNTLYNNTNLPSSPLSKLFRSFADECKLGYGPQWFVYTVRDHYIRLNVERIAEQGERASFTVEVIDLTGSENDETRSMLDKTGRSMFLIFNTVLCFDLNIREITVLQRGNFIYERDPHNNKLHHAFREVTTTILEHIHPFDQDEFKKFFDFETLRDRVAEEDRPYVTCYFRTKQPNGAYIWKAHTLLYMRDTNLAVYCTHYSPIDDADFMKKLATINHSEGAMLSQKNSFINRSIMNNSTINMFWKDKDRRFIAANNSFLDAFGFKDVSEILGKTDEDMGWHVDNEPFANDEYEVIKHGKKMSFRPGVCIIKGVAHNIIASKEPLYNSKGQIVGLVGYFTNADELNESIHDLNNMSVLDRETGLMSPQALINTIADYCKDWQLHRNNFAVIHVELKEYYKIAHLYGESIAAEMFYEIGRIIKDQVGIKGNVARLYSGKIVILMKCEKKEDIARFATGIRQALNSVRTLAEQEVTLYPKINIHYADERNNVFELLEMAAASSYLSQAGGETQLHQANSLDNIWSTYENLDELVCACDADTYDIIYMNRKTRDQYGVHNIAEVRGCKCYEFLQKNAQPCANCLKHDSTHLPEGEFEFFNTELNKVFHISSHIIRTNDQNIRIEIAKEEQSLPANSNQNQEEHMHLLLSECMRLALEESDMDDGLQKLVEHIGRTLGSERTYIFELTGDKKWNNTYEWCATGIEPQKDWLQNIHYDVTEVWNKQFLEKNTVIIPNVENIKEHDPETYAYLTQQNITSVIVAPFYIEGKLAGFYGIDNPPEDNMHFANAMLKAISRGIATMVNKRDLRETLEMLSYRDSFSQLNNRNALNRLLPSIDTNKSIGILFCDICGLKMVNDTYGHFAGDKLILQVCQAVSEIFAGYRIFRWGGDEILILGSGITHADFQKRTFTLKTRSYEQHTPLAIGAIWESTITTSAEDLISIADKQMYEDKHTIYNHINLKQIFDKNNVIK